jgi:hypothetical protein
MEAVYTTKWVADLMSKLNSAIYLKIFDRQNFWQPCLEMVLVRETKGILHALEQKLRIWR